MVIMSESVSRDIVKLLLNHGKLTLPKIAELLGKNVGTVDYHLKKLADKDIVKVQKKKYGTLYSLNPELTSVRGQVMYELIVTFVFTTVGIIYLLQQSFLFASIALAISSLAGLISVFDKAYHHKKGRLDEVLQNL
jgi:DNA-binding transcriptional ArsR family regulator